MQKTILDDIKKRVDLKDNKEKNSSFGTASVKLVH